MNITPQMLKKAENDLKKNHAKVRYFYCSPVMREIIESWDNPTFRIEEKDGKEYFLGAEVVMMPIALRSGGDTVYAMFKGE